MTARGTVTDLTQQGTAGQRHSRSEGQRHSRSEGHRHSRSGGWQVIRESKSSTGTSLTLSL